MESPTNTDSYKVWRNWYIKARSCWQNRMNTHHFPLCIKMSAEKPKTITPNESNKNLTLLNKKLT